MAQTKQRKVALMGFRSVGKSSLAIQFVQGQFVDSYDPTIEETFNKNIKIRNQDFELHVVDTAGQDEYSIFPTQYAVDIHGTGTLQHSTQWTIGHPRCGILPTQYAVDFYGYVLVYSINSQKSFEVVQVLYDKIADLVGNPRVPVVLVGNKKDLESERAVTLEEGERLAKQINAVFLETSAKDNLCVNDLFQNIVLQIETLNGNMEAGEGKKSCLIS